jgi:hypothetical protein
MRKLYCLLMFLIGLTIFGGTTTVQAADNDYGIKIDGNFSDWADKKKTDIQSNDDTYNIKHEALLADGKNIYFYLNMSPNHGNGYKNLQPAGYELRVGDKLFWLTIQDPYNLQINEKRAVKIWAYEQDNTGGGVNEILPNAKAYISRVRNNDDPTINNGSTDKMEFEIPFSDLKAVSTTSQKVTMHNGNLGNQTLTTEGGSTGPVILAISGLAIAMFGIIKIPKISELRKSLHE